MNRRQKIIVSVTGIFLVLLLLVGLTYGYFLTEINGNNNSKSISVSTANLQLVYGDDDGNVIGDGELIVPGTTFDAKTFTVTNEGNATTDYVVVIENATSTFKNNDFVYTLSCTSDGWFCAGVDTETTYPINGGVLVANTIEVGKTHTYSFTLKYVDTGSNQSDDMNKTLTGKINIKDISGENPYSSNTSLLSYNIINNAITGVNGTTLTNLPVTTPAVTGSAENEKVLSVTSDDYGTSYYYRGGVEDNYVNFAGMCWKIVRIEGDGSTKLILEDYNTTCNSETYTGNWSDENFYYFGYDSDRRANYLNYSGGLADAFKTFQTSKLSSVLDKLKVDEWCYDNTLTATDSDGNEYYGAYTRIYTNKKPSLNCTGTKLTKFKDGVDMYVATLTADEISFAGATVEGSNLSYYLINDNASSNYRSWWTLSLDYYDRDYNDYGADYAFSISPWGKFFYYYYVTHKNYYARPAITLKANATISTGTGTQTDPYIIN